MTGALPSYGLWVFALVNGAIFIIFAFSFFKPQTSRGWLHCILSTLSWPTNAPANARNYLDKFEHENNI